MDIYEFADIIGQNITITRYYGQDGRFSASFVNGEIKKGACLSSEYGNGKSAREAVNEYKYKIEGKLLVINAMSSKHRLEFRVPKLEEVKY